MAHDQSEQYREFIAGNKQLCVLEQRKDAETFERALYHATHLGQYDLGQNYHVHLHTLLEGTELVLARDFAVIAKYLSILNDAELWRIYPNAARTALGAMFGYSKTDCAEYNAKLAREPDFCKCSKCVGINNAEIASYE